MWRIRLSNPVEYLGCRILFEDQQEPREELQFLYGQKQVKERQQTLAKAEFEEQLRFFNRPHAKADLTHWSKASYWTLDEAIALSFGKAPEVVTWKRVKEYCGSPQCPGSSFAVKYGRVRDLALRAKASKQLDDPVLPNSFLAWARRMEIEVPGELIEQVEKRGNVIADWKDLYDKLKEQVDKLVEERDKIASICKTVIQERDELNQKLEATLPTASDASLRQSERDSLLKMVLGMAMAAYGYKPGAPRNTVTGDKRRSISAGLQQLGLTLDADTVRKFIKEAEARFKDIIPNPHKS
jgi:hypothetical protein